MAPLPAMEAARPPGGFPIPRAAGRLSEAWHVKGGEQRLFQRRIWGTAVMECDASRAAWGGELGLRMNFVAQYMRQILQVLPDFQILLGQKAHSLHGGPPCCAGSFLI